MSSSVLHRRRSERYAQLLDEASGARRHHARSSVDDELNDLVELSHRLTEATPEVTVRPEFRSDTRAFLMAVAERDGIGKTAVTEPAVGRAQVATGRAQVGAGARAGAKNLFRQKPQVARITTRRGRARGAILVGLAVGTLALSGISAASGDAKPGDALYGMKRQAESAQLALASGDAKGDLYLSFARQRLTEAASIAYTSKSFTSTLNDMDNETKLGVHLLLTNAARHKDTTALASVKEFVAEQMKQLDALSARVPFAAAEQHNHLVDSRGVLFAAQQRSNDLSCASMTIVSSDPYGPIVTCRESGQVTPNSTPKSGNGKSSTSKPGQKAPTTTTPASVPNSSTAAGTSTPSNTPSAPAANAAAPNTPAPSTTDDGGLLGDVQHLLGGL